jgi:hypothetical protein
MEMFEDRLKRLKSMDISDDCNAEARDAAPLPRRVVPNGQKRELSDKAANLIATTLKSFLRS